MSLCIGTGLYAVLCVCGQRTSNKRIISENLSTHTLFISLTYGQDLTERGTGFNVVAILVYYSLYFTDNSNKMLIKMFDTIPSYDSQGQILKHI